MTTPPLHRFLFVLFVPLVVFAGCSDDPAQPSVSSVGCRLNSDCEAGLVCLEGACAEAEPCVGADCPCMGDSDCEADEVCRAGECLAAECNEDADCGLGQVCEGRQCLTDRDADRDRDGTPDAVDNCPDLENSDQDDTDRDGRGDGCDPDDDNDGIVDEEDNCPALANADQLDHNGDGLGNACDPEWRGTTVAGRVVAHGLAEPDVSAARVALSGVEATVTPEADGTFVFEHALARGGAAGLTVRWPGFGTASVIVEVPSGIDRHEVGDIDVYAVTDATLAGTVTLEGQADHTGITVIVAHRDGRPFGTLVTGPDGRFVTAVTREPFVLAFYRDGYLPVQDVDVV